MERVPSFLRSFCLAACGLLLAYPAAADRIFKYVDKEGRVNYSSTPPADAEGAGRVTQIQTLGAPRPEDVEAAKKRAEEEAKLARELFRERRQADVEYERIRAAAIDREFQEQLAAAQYPSDGVYYPASGYLPYYPMWGVPSVKPRPPFRDHPPFLRPGFHKSKASFTLEPTPVQFRRR